MRFATQFTVGFRKTGHWLSNSTHKIQILMKQTVTLWHFRNAFNELRPNQFSHEALKALFNYLEGLEFDTCTDMELDVVALCCDWSEFTSALNACQAWGFKADDENEALEKLRDNTQVIIFDGGILVQDF